MRGLQERGIIRRNKMLHAAIALFLEHGYEKTTTAQIARQAGMSPASFFAAFENKEALLLALTKIMFSGQFQKAEGMLAEVEKPAAALWLGDGAAAAHHGAVRASAGAVRHGLHAADDVGFHLPQYAGQALRDLPAVSAPGA